MDLSASLYLTAKGDDEIKHRTHKLDVRKRSLLLLLDKPRTLEYLFGKTVLRREEADEEMRHLLRTGFIATGNANDNVAVPDAAAAAAAVQPVPQQAGASSQLHPDIVVSEAKFLLIDFCVDSFGTNSEAFCKNLRSCNGVAAVDAMLGAIVAAVGKQYPERLPALLKLIREINETAG